MIRMTANTPLPVLVLMIVAAILLGGCMGTTVSPWEMDEFVPGRTTEAEVTDELGVDELVSADDAESVRGGWGIPEGSLKYLIREST